MICVVTEMMKNVLIMRQNHCLPQQKTLVNLNHPQRTQ